MLDIRDIDKKFWEAIERENQPANLQVVTDLPLIVKIKQQAEPQVPEDDEE